MTASARSTGVDQNGRANNPVHTLNLRFDGDPPRTAQQLAYQVVRRAILESDLEPGTRLTQGQLAEQLQISTTPVREALRRLAGEGLVRIDAHRGAIVRGLDEEELLEIYEMRLLLEPLAIRKSVASISDTAIDEAEQLWERMNDHSDIGAWSDANREFHAILAEAATSPTLTSVLRGLRDRAAPYVRYSIVLQPGFSVTANQEHRELVDAFRARDPDRAAAIEEKHLRATLAAVMAHRRA